MELLLNWPAADRAELVAAVVASGHPLVAPLGQAYPGDVGVVAALLLNELRLRTGDAVFMPAGNLHAYLSGFGVEVMAASDNVLRGGLTPKPVNVAELLRVLRYEVLDEPVLHPMTLAPGLVTWPVPVPEFSLTRAEITAQNPAGVPLPGGGPRIICCLAGTAQLRAGDQVIECAGGDSVFLSAEEPSATAYATGEMANLGATVFQTAVNS
jgi:mannose-6-phosphate isomerase